MKKRSIFWDNYKGILIILVVFGHFIYECANRLQGSFAHDVFTFIYIFHMPAFVFASGYLSKSVNACRPKAIVKLVLCYILLNGFLALYYCGCMGMEVSLLTPYASSWYILALIVWRLTIKYAVKIRWILPAAIAGALLIGFWDEFGNVFAMARIVAFYPFFLMGYLLDEKKVEKHLSGRTPLKIAMGIAAFLIGSLALFILVRKVSFSSAMLAMGAYVSGKDMLYRGFIMAAATAAILVMMYVVPNVKIPLLTKIGKNSLLIYIIHRFLTFVFDWVFPYENYSGRYLIYAALATIFTVAVFSGDWLNRWFHLALDKLSHGILAWDSKRGRRIVAALLVASLVILAIPLGKIAVERIRPSQEEQPVDTPSVVDVPSVIEDTVKISFVGDLLLLKDQVEAAYDEQTQSYNFDAMFVHTKQYLSQADLAIGVFEGPTAGGEKGYTTSDYYDRGKLNINLPDSFAYAVKEAGIDFVTTANNHLLDMGMEGAMRTLDVLDQVGLAHSGSYRNQEEKDQVAIVEVEGIRIGILTYTWAMNDYSNEAILQDYPFVTSLLPEETDPFFPQLMAEIEEDFAQAKKAEADLIVVMPHMGTQFSHETDDFQKFWNQKFADLGADIILGDHAHAVQPMEQLGETLVVNCPGNFANSFISYDGDATAIVEIYVDRTSRKAVASAVIPMYTQEMRSGYFRAIPIYEILTQNEIYDQMAHIDLERINQVQELVTRVMVGQPVSVYQAQPRYFFINGEYAPYTYKLLDDMGAYENTQLYKLIDAATNVVFIGDSITNGSHNYGHPWYEPLMADFKDKTVQNLSFAGATIKSVTDYFTEDIINSRGDLYLVAIGTNDIRYQDAQLCALTPEAYVERMESLTGLILQSNPDAQIVLLSPWVTLDNDANSKLQHNEKLEAINQYSKALEEFANKHTYCFIDANPKLLSFYETHQRYQYTFDGIHPNATKGIDLYSWAVLESGRDE